MKIFLVVSWEKISFGAIWPFYDIFQNSIGCGQNSARLLLLLDLKTSGHD